MEPAGDFFQPGRQIDGGTDAGEVEPVAAADIAVQNFSDVQRYPKSKALDGVADRVAQGPDAFAVLARSLQHVAADLSDIAVLFGNRERREQAVAHELQHFA